MYKYSSIDDNEYFISNCFKVIKISSKYDEGIFDNSNSLNNIDYYALLEKFLTTLRMSSFRHDRNSIVRDLKNIYFFIYDITEEECIKINERKLTDIIPKEDYDDLIIKNYQYDFYAKYHKLILVGYAIIYNYNDKYSSIEVFDIFLRGHNLGNLFYNKLYNMILKNDKYLFVSFPKDSAFKYWAVNIGIYNQYEYWSQMNGYEYNYSNIEQEYRTFLSNKLHWFDHFIDNIIILGKILYYNRYLLNNKKYFYDHLMKYQSIMKQVNTGH